MASMGAPLWVLACTPHRKRRTSAWEGLNMGREGSTQGKSLERTGEGGSDRARLLHRAGAASYAGPALAHLHWAGAKVGSRVHFVAVLQTRHREKCHECNANRWCAVVGGGAGRVFDRRLQLYQGHHPSQAGPAGAHREGKRIRQYPPVDEPGCDGAGRRAGGGGGSSAFLGVPSSLRHPLGAPIMREMVRAALSSVGSRRSCITAALVRLA